MAFFGKPPAKKPPTPGGTPARAPSAPSARDLATRAEAKRPAGSPAKPPEPPSDTTVTGTSLIEWQSPGHPSFEVAQANPGLCAVLEDAALRYASGHPQQARALLEEGVANDHDTRISPLAWLALFDLLQRAGDKAGFDQVAMRYVVQFERSAPPWEGTGKPEAGPRVVPGGFVGLTGKLNASVGTQFEALKRAFARGVAEVRLDLAQVAGFDDEGARILATALADARRRRVKLQVQRTEKLKPLLEAAVKKGRDGGEGAWLLSLELLQWSGGRAAFEDRAIEYAVNFELSPPSWEPPELPAAPDAPGEAAPVADGVAAESAEGDALVWTGVLAGSAAPQLGRLAEHASGRAVVAVDLTLVDRIDFVCAGALLNTINRIEGQRKSVQLVGASPIIRALLLLIGISPRHFVKKA